VTFRRSNWHRATRSLTPFLSHPHEIPTVGTGPLPVGGPHCAQAPVNALEALGATGALVSIQERAPANADNSFSPRATRFRLRSADRWSAAASIDAPGVAYGGQRTAVRGPFVG
jgi:hypothetical protein